MSMVTLVEGESDRAAVETLLDRLGRAPADLRVVAVGGAMNMGNHLAELVPDGIRVRGLVDHNEAPVVAAVLERLGVADVVDPGSLHLHGFFTCHQDLEDELIRALGTDRVTAILAEQKELAPFRTFQSQPAWRGRPLADQLHRFLGIRSGRKIRYGTLLAAAIDLAAIPAPLAGLLRSMEPDEQESGRIE